VTVTHEIVRSEEVVFEETGERRAVVRDCQICFLYREVYGTGVVSPTGVAHIVEYEYTLCGHDATGETWWWSQ